MRAMRAETTTRRRGRIRIEPGTKRVRAYLGGEWWPTPPARCWCGRSRTTPPTTSRSPTCATELLEPDGGVAHSPSRGDGRTFTVRAGGKRGAARGSALRRLADRGAARPDPARLGLDGRLVRGGRAGVHASARSRTRAWTSSPSSRHVRVEVDGTTVAESTSPRMLFETGLPVRYYLPKTHVRMDLLTPTDTVTHCPYKGQAE